MFFRLFSLSQKAWRAMAQKPITHITLLLSQMLRPAPWWLVFRPQMLCLVKVLLQVHQQTFFNINDAFQLISCACIHNSASLLQNRLGFYVYLFFALALGQLYVMMSPAGGPYWSQPEVYCTSYTTLQCVMLLLPASFNTFIFSVIAVLFAFLFK